MSRSGASGAPPSTRSPSTKRRAVASAATLRTAEQARLLIEEMLKEMQMGLSDPAYRSGEEWERLFGSKQSMVANLQKLVAALAALPGEVEQEAGEEAARNTPISPEEMAMLKSWVVECGV